MATNNNNQMDQGPKMSWSVILMAVGMIISAAFNYAAYDTRITILERNALQDEFEKKELARKLEATVTLTQKVDNVTNADSRDIANLTNRLDKLELRVDNALEKRGK